MSRLVVCLQARPWIPWAFLVFAIMAPLVLYFRNHHLQTLKAGKRPPGTHGDTRKSTTTGRDHIRLDNKNRRDVVNNNGACPSTGTGTPRPNLTAATRHIGALSAT